MRRPTGTRCSGGTHTHPVGPIACRSSANACSEGGPGGRRAHDDALLRRTGDRQGLLGHRHRAHDRMVQLVRRCLTRRHPVIPPQRDELRAPHRQLADQLREQGVLRVAADGDPQVADDGARLAPRVRVQLPAIRIQEQHPAHVRPPRGVLRAERVQVPGQQGVPERVPRQHVRAPTQDQRGHPVEGAQEVPRLVGELLGPRTTHPGRPTRSAGEPLEVRALVVVEQQGAGDRVAHLGRGPTGPARGACSTRR